MWESNPQEFSGSDGFRDRLALPMPNLPFLWRKSWELNSHGRLAPATGSRGRAIPLGETSALESGRGDTSRTCMVQNWTRVWSPLHCRLCYAPLLVHAAGLEPAVSLGSDPDLQSGAVAAAATHAKSVIVKNDEGRELEAPEDTLRRTLLPRMAAAFGTLAKHARPRHPEKASLPSSLSSQVLQLSNNKKSGRLQQGSSLPAPTILLDFLRRFGSGSRSR